MNSIIHVPADYVADWRQSWPCSGLHDAQGVTVSLAPGGDLVGVEGIPRDGVLSDTLTALVADYLHHMATEQDSRMRIPFDRCADTPCPSRAKGNDHA